MCVVSCVHSAAMDGRPATGSPPLGTRHHGVIVPGRERGEGRYSEGVAKYLPCILGLGLCDVSACRGSKKPHGYGKAD